MHHALAVYPAGSNPAIFYQLLYFWPGPGPRPAADRRLYGLLVGMACHQRYGAGMCWKRQVGGGVCVCVRRPDDGDVFKVIIMLRVQG